MPSPPLALFGDLGLQELLLVMLAAVMIFGRRLPEVAGQAFAQFQKARRTLTRMWRETGIEQELRRIQRDVDHAVPRDASPRRLVERETRELEQAFRSAPVPPARTAPLPVPAPEGDPPERDRDEPPVAPPVPPPTPPSAEQTPAQSPVSPPEPRREP